MEDYKLRIITPDRVFYEGTADMIEFNTTEGEIGVLPGHIPMTVIIKPGVLTITEKDEVKEAALHSGFVEILPDRMTILAEVVEWPGEIDLERAASFTSSFSVMRKSVLRVTLRKRIWRERRPH